MYFALTKINEFDYPESRELHCSTCKKETPNRAHINWRMTYPFGITMLGYTSFQSVWTICEVCNKKKGKSLREIKKSFGYLPEGLKAEGAWVDFIGHSILALLVLVPLLYILWSSLFGADY